MKIKISKNMCLLFVVMTHPFYLSYESHQWYEIQPISFLIIGCALQIFGLCVVSHYQQQGFNYFVWT